MMLSMLSFSISAIFFFLLAQLGLVWMCWRGVSRNLMRIVVSLFVQVVSFGLDWAINSTIS